MPETLLSASNILLFGRVVDDLSISEVEHDPFQAIRGTDSKGNKHLENIVADGTANFARIYGISFEGQFYDLPAPMLFLVHGGGEIAETKVGGDTKDPDEIGVTSAHPRQSRAPEEASRSGLGAADFSFADDLRVWSYDKADYTIRMDVETGKFEQVLLDLIFDGGGPGGVAGVNVRGVNVRGVNVRGVNVRGVNVRGVNVRGGGGGD